jgi:hypothetical protein
MRQQDALFLAGESIPFGGATPAPRGRMAGVRRVARRTGELANRDDLATRAAAAALMFGGLAWLTWAALGYVAAL